MAEERDTKARDEAAQYYDHWGPTSFARAEINLPMIWNFLECAEDPNPIYWDEDFAKQSRFGRLICPPQMIMTMSGGHWWAPDYVTEKAKHAIEAQGDNPVAAAGEIVTKYGYTTSTNVTREDEFLEPIGPGDGRLSSRSKVIDVSEEKQTRPGKGVFITSILEYSVEAHDRPVVRSRNILLMYNSSTPRA